MPSNEMSERVSDERLAELISETEKYCEYDDAFKDDLAAFRELQQLRKQSADLAAMRELAKELSAILRTGIGQLECSDEEAAQMDKRIDAALARAKELLHD